MDNVERNIVTLSALATSRPPHPPGLIPLLKRAPKSVAWKTVKAYWLLKREAQGFFHRLERRRIAHFLHIGKTGGTAVRSALHAHLKAGDYEIIFHDHAIGLKDLPRGEKFFFFVRDPISRFVSAFYSRQRQGRPRHDVPWAPGEEAAFARFATPNELALALSDPDTERVAAAVSAMKNIIHIQSPHWTWFRDENYFLSRRSDILYVGFQETLDEDFSLLGKLLNLPESATLPDDEVTAHKNPAGVNKQLAEEAIKNLKAWYHRDYQFLELCRAIATQIRDDFERRSSRPESAGTMDAASPHSFFPGHSAPERDCGEGTPVHLGGAPLP
jgi:hypothetical protein